MCGHFGVIYKGLNGMYQAHANIFKEGLYADALRGEDATGVCAVSNDGSVEVIKEATEASWFLSTKEYKEISEQAVKTGKALLGHNRKATVGGHADANAHPFVIDDELVFIHNGSLTNWKQWGYDTEVDSNSLGHLIKDALRSDNESALSEAFSKVNGAYACVWYDLKKHEVCLIRNSQRPMFIVETGNAFYYGSELDMLLWILKRNNQVIVGHSELPVDVLCTFDLNSSFDSIKPKLKHVEVKKYIPATKTTHKGTQGIERRGTKKGGVSKSSFRRWLKENKGEPVTFVVEDVETTENGTVILLEGFIDLAEAGIDMDNVAVSAMLLNSSMMEAKNNYHYSFVEAAIIDGKWHNEYYAELYLGTAKLVTHQKQAH